MLVYRGHGWLRWLIALYFVLNSLGAPRGMSATFGPMVASLLTLTLMIGGLGSALALCFGPGISAFLRYQRAQRVQH